jgi:hypothetical protein
VARARRQHIGVGARIAQRLVELGYIKVGTDKEPDVMRFWREKRPSFPSSYLYDWINDRKVPGDENQGWLATHLECDRGWLVFGPAMIAQAKKKK